MKAEDLRTKTPDELNETLLDLKKQQFNLRFQMSQGQLANSAQVRTLRRNIARVYTFLNPAANAAKSQRRRKRQKRQKSPKKHSRRRKDRKLKKPAAKKAAE